ncbi:MAG: hypothetical protein KGL36_03875 [Gammaproteobacteria bacterium]|nr:hypothetical protein [Gammaproteobacteria bacterium]
MKVASWFSLGERPDVDPREEPATHDPGLDRIAQGVLGVDARLRVISANRAAGTLLRNTRLVGAEWREILKPLASEETFARLSSALRERDGARRFDEVELRVPGADGAPSTVWYRLEIQPGTDTESGPAHVLVISDRTDAVHQAHEIAELRAELQSYGEILRALLRLGAARFAAAVRKTSDAMEHIDAILKQPAREQAAFRDKLDAALAQVDQIRREAVLLRLTSLEIAARSFEDAVHDLRDREHLSGSEFLPLAVKLDALLGRLALLRTLTRNAMPAATADERPAVTDNGTQIIDAPRFFAEAPRDRATAGPASVPGDVAVAGIAAAAATGPGRLEAALASLTEHIGEEEGRRVRIEFDGLDAVPSVYRPVVKNVAIQLIRNAIIHGIETGDAREAAGKPSTGTLRVSFVRQPTGGCELRFQDDGRGIDPVRVRRTAVERGLLRPDEAAALSDRQAIKLIFRSGYASATPDGTSTRRGLLLVRRYVDDAGGRIALASEPGRNTRFKVLLPPPAR